jgi:hypothetical protein
MTTPIQGKTGEAIVEEYKMILDRLYENIPRNAPDEDWIRSAMRSLIQRMVDELPRTKMGGVNDDTIDWLANVSYNNAIRDCTAVLIRERDSI